MSNEAITAVSKSSITPSGRKFVMMALADYADEAWSCFPSIKQLAEFTAQGEKTVRDHLNALEADGYLSRKRARREDGTLGRYRFHINQRRISPAADFASGEKRTSPAADFATHNPHIEPSIVSYARASVQSPFDAFWATYPHKVGKADARRKFTSALERADFQTIMSGLERYVGKTDDRPWCNPATWLHQDRWEDQPAQSQPRASPQKPMSASEFALRLSQEPDHGPESENPGEDHFRSASGLRLIG